MDVFQILIPYQKRIDKDIASSETHFGTPSRLTDACFYALSNGGKRFRPAIVHMIAETFKRQADVSHAALAIEFFHTASLIADDLPCMDNDDYRRGQLSLHKKFGESLAILASYALISEGYAMISRQKCAHPEITRIAIENASLNTGCLGAAGGQYLDLYEKDAKEKALRLKTVSLFEIAFVFGWLFGGGDHRRLSDVKKAAGHFGMAFQIADDLQDLRQDKEKEAFNSMLFLGKEKAFSLFEEEISEFQKSLIDLELEACPLREMAETLSESMMLAAR